ncbi:MAG TPA: hypothetical protein VKB59_06685 [Micromonosporaceae bacterium]|nr:hypothetical protein [Micromonosporaceae bacterium]
MTHRRVWTACRIAALLLVVGACGHPATARGTLGALSSSTSAGPTSAPAPSNAAGRPSTTRPGNGQTGSTSPAPQPDSSSFNIRQIKEDYSITLSRSSQSGRPECSWAGAGKGANSVGVFVIVAHDGGSPLRQPTSVNLRVADDLGDQLNSTTAFQERLANLPVGIQTTGFTLRITVSLVLANPDSDPTDDAVSVVLSVPAGGGPGTFAAIDCTAA